MDVHKDCKKTDDCLTCNPGFGLKLKYQRAFNDALEDLAGIKAKDVREICSMAVPPTEIHTFS